MKELIRKKIDLAVKNIFDQKLEDYDVLVSEKEDFGDFSTNIAFVLAKKLGKNPKDIAQSIIDKLQKSKEFSRIDFCNGYINFFMNHDIYSKELNVILRDKSKYGSNNVGKKKMVQVEFISGNPTGPLTMGNGRGGFSGDTLANVLKKNGYNAKREYYVNDAGNQVKKVLAKSIYVALGMDIPLEEGEDIYKGDYVEEIARKIKKQKGIDWINNHLSKTGETGAKMILEDIIKKDVKFFGIKYDRWFSEASLFRDGIVHKMWEYLKAKDLVYESEGAYWLKTSQFGDEKDRVVRKSDGEFTYMMSDVAYFYERFAIRKFNKVIMILGADHHGYIGRAQAIVEILGFKGKLDIILTQFVRLLQDGKEVRMSKRKGTFITLKEAVEDLGVEASRYYFISRDSTSHIDIDMNIAKAQNNQNPVFYIQYASARINSVLGKIKKQESKKTKKQENSFDKYELAVIKKLGQFPELVKEVGENYQVYRIALFAHELASDFHKFYDNCRIIGDEREATRIKIIKATEIVLSDALELMGIKAAKKM